MEGQQNLNFEGREREKRKREKEEAHKQTLARIEEIDMREEQKRDDNPGDPGWGRMH